MPRYRRWGYLTVMPLLYKGTFAIGFNNATEALAFEAIVHGLAKKRGLTHASYTAADNN